MKYSKQRDLVLKTLRENVVHPTADFVYAKAKEKDPALSLATVYRNLNRLAEKGEIKKISGLGNIARFDHNISEHFHFQCTQCGKIFDISCEIAPGLKDMLKIQTGLTAITCDLSFQGICPDCKTHCKTNKGE